MAKMNEKTFQKLLKAYGANPNRWPDNLRQEALNFATTKEAQNLLEEAQRLDILLDQYPEPQPADNAFLKRLENISRAPQAHEKILAAQQESKGLLDWVADLMPAHFGLVPQLTGLALAALLGVVVGFTNVAAPTVAQATFDASGFLLGNPVTENQVRKFAE